MTTDQQTTDDDNTPVSSALMPVFDQLARASTRDLKPVRSALQTLKRYCQQNSLSTAERQWLTKRIAADDKRISVLNVKDPQIIPQLPGLQVEMWIRRCISQHLPEHCAEVNRLDWHYLRYLSHKVLYEVDKLIFLRGRHVHARANERYKKGLRLVPRNYDKTPLCTLISRLTAYFTHIRKKQSITMIAQAVLGHSSIQATIIESFRACFSTVNLSLLYTSSIFNADGPQQKIMRNAKQQAMHCIHAVGELAEQCAQLDLGKALKTEEKHTITQLSQAMQQIASSAAQFERELSCLKTDKTTEIITAFPDRHRLNHTAASYRHFLMLLIQCDLANIDAVWQICANNGYTVDKPVSIAYAIEFYASLYRAMRPPDTIIHMNLAITVLSDLLRINNGSAAMQNRRTKDMHGRPIHTKYFFLAPVIHACNMPNKTTVKAVIDFFSLDMLEIEKLCQQSRCPRPVLDQHALVLASTRNNIHGIKLQHYNPRLATRQALASKAQLLRDEKINQRKTTHPISQFRLSLQTVQVALEEDKRSADKPRRKKTLLASIDCEADLAHQLAILEQHGDTLTQQQLLKYYRQLWAFCQKHALNYRQRLRVASKLMALYYGRVFTLVYVSQTKIERVMYDNLLSEISRLKKSVESHRRQSQAIHCEKTADLVLNYFFAHYSAQANSYQSPAGLTKDQLVKEITQTLNANVLKAKPTHRDCLVRLKNTIQNSVTKTRVPHKTMPNKTNRRTPVKRRLAFDTRARHNSNNNEQKRNVDKGIITSKKPSLHQSFNWQLTPHRINQIGHAALSHHYNALVNAIQPIADTSFVPSIWERLRAICAIYQQALNLANVPICAEPTGSASISARVRNQQIFILQQHLHKGFLASEITVANDLCEALHCDASIIGDLPFRLAMQINVCLRRVITENRLSQYAISAYIGGSTPEELFDKLTADVNKQPPNARSLNPNRDIDIFISAPQPILCKLAMTLSPVLDDMLAQDGLITRNALLNNYYHHQKCFQHLWHGVPLKQRQQTFDITLAVNSPAERIFQHEVKWPIFPTVLPLEISRHFAALKARHSGMIELETEKPYHTMPIAWHAFVLRKTANYLQAGHHLGEVLLRTLKALCNDEQLLPEVMSYFIQRYGKKLKQTSPLLEHTNPDVQFLQQIFKTPIQNKTAGNNKHRTYRIR